MWCATVSPQPMAMPNHSPPHRASGLLLFVVPGKIGAVGGRAAAHRLHVMPNHGGKMAAVRAWCGVVIADGGWRVAPLPDLSVSLRPIVDLQAQGWERGWIGVLGQASVP